MTATHDHLGPTADDAVDVSRRPAGPGADHGPDVAPIVRSADPRLHSAGSAAPGLMALQRSAGNAAVASLVAPKAVQRAPVEIDEMTTRVGVDESAAPANAPAPPGGAGGGAVTSDGTNTTITGATISLAAPLTSTDGVIRAGTIIADSVVASTYSPGAGNIM